MEPEEGIMGAYDLEPVGQKYKQHLELASRVGWGCCKLLFEA